MQNTSRNTFMDMDMDINTIPEILEGHSQQSPSDANASSSAPTGGQINQSKAKHANNNVTLLSQSAPNTSFTAKEALMGEQCDLNLNPTQAQGECTPQNLSCRKLVEKSQNFIINDEHHEKEIIRKGHGKVEPEEGRAHRLDVLWRVEEGRVEDNDSVSSCLISPAEEGFGLLKFQQTKGKILPRFAVHQTQRDDEENMTLSQTKLDPNDNVVKVIERKEDEGGRGDGRRNEGTIRQGDAFERLDRRPLIQWPWSNGNYRVSVRFEEPEFRTAFSNRVIYLKALQWLLITLWTFGVKHIPFFTKNTGNLNWTIYISTFMLLTAFVFVRSVNYLGSNWGSATVLMGYTVCIGHLCGMLYLIYNSPTVPIVCITLFATYLLSATTFGCMSIDSESSLVFYPIFVYTIMTSIISFWLIFAVEGITIKDPLGKMATTWFPCCLLCLIISSIEMMEIQTILNGNRMPLNEQDWVLAATFLL